MKATKDGAIWVSQVYEQEVGENSWYQYQVEVAEKPRPITVLDGSTETELKTPNEVVTGEKVVLYNASNGFKEGELGSVTSTVGDNISSALLQGTIDVGFQRLFGLFFSPDGLNMYVGTNTNVIYQFILSTPWDITSVIYTGKSVSLNNVSNLLGFFITEDGTKLYTVCNNIREIRQYSFSSAWDITSITYNTSLNVEGIENMPFSAFFTPDGRTMFMGGNSSNRVYQYELTVPWNIGSATYTGKSYNLSDRIGNFHSMYISPDGKKLYVSDNGTRKIYQYSFTAPWNISSLTYDNSSLSVSGEPGQLFISPDGTKMFHTIYPTSNIYYYDFPNSAYLTLQADISSFNLTSPPEKAWKKPTRVYISLESNPDRCLWQDEDISDKLQNTTTNYFEFSDTRQDLLVPGDKLIVNGNETTVSAVTIESNVYKITVPDQDSTITTVVIPVKTQPQTLQERQLDTSNSDFIVSKYQPVTKTGRALRVKVKGDTDTEVSKIQVDLWTAE